MKKSLIIALALMLVLAFATSAMAAQVLTGGQYLSTTPMGMSRTGDSTGSTFSRTYQQNKFNPDGKTNYPYEIYLPNEQRPDNYRIHTSYTKNTDACASCHSTHTAVGASLLQWYSAYETCMACHDGTVSTTYDVVNGKIGTSNKPAFGGMFGTGLEASLSNHNVTGALEIAAAPGGSVVATTFAQGKAKNWTIEFGCESCHTPHGLGGNARILHPDANNAASDRAIVAKFDEITPQGQTTATAGIVPTVEDSTYYVVRPNTKTVDAATYASYNGYYYLSGYPYAVRLTVNNTIYKADGNFKVDNSLGYTRILVTNPALATFAATPGNIVKVLGTPSLKVTMQISNYLGFTGTENVTHMSGMNAYCGACHTDYNTATADASTFKTGTFYNDYQFTGSGKQESGVFSKAHRHQVGYQWHGDTAGLKFEKGQKGVDSAFSYTNETRYGVECLTCHVAHGTSYDYWNETLVKANVAGPSGDTWTTNELVELAGSSALKRMPNMGTCEACHDKETGNAGYAANSGQTPNPLTATSDIADVTLLDNFWFIGEPIANAKASTWVGSAKCEPCHAEKVAGWKANKHQTASSKRVDASCGAFDMTNPKMNCHLLGWNALNRPATAAANPNFYYVSSTDRGVDSAVTCEACHGSAAKHIQAPSSKNIYNPGRLQVGETTAQAFERENKSCGKCHSDREVVTASTTVAQINDGTIHDGPSSYATSKHYTSGLVGCADCHDAHTEGALKLEYKKLCASCHDSANLGLASGNIPGVPYVMGDGSDHTFSWGLAGGTMIPTGAIATILPNTVASLTYSQVKANNVLDRYRVSPSINIKSADLTSTYYSFTGGTWTLEAPAGARIGVTGATYDYAFDATRPRITFSATSTTNIVGTWKVSYVNTLNPFITAPLTTIFTVNP